MHHYHYQEVCKRPIPLQKHLCHKHVLLPPIHANQCKMRTWMCSWNLKP
jgi:hypothetical protein